MSEEEKEFKKQCDETLLSIYSKINEEEKNFLSYVVNQFNNICERNNKAIEYIENADYLDDAQYPLMYILTGDEKWKN